LLCLFNRHTFLFIRAPTPTLTQWPRGLLTDSGGFFIFLGLATLFLI
jgi:hypothetical protein